MRYLVTIYEHKGDYSAEVPDLPGCVAAAKSVEGVRKLITKAINLHVDLMHQSGQKIPRPRRNPRPSPSEMKDVAFCTWIDVDLRKPVTS
jgi:predicted RNase H-like HicB family nuclease